MSVRPQSALNGNGRQLACLNFPGVSQLFYCRRLAVSGMSAAAFKHVFMLLQHLCSSQIQPRNEQ